MEEPARADFHSNFARALAFATQLHATQVRKQGDIPYISHLIVVAGLVLEHGVDRDEAVAFLTACGMRERLAGGTAPDGDD